MPAITMELSQTQQHNTGSIHKSKSQEHFQKQLSPTQPQYKRPIKSTYKHQPHADMHKVDTSGVFTRSWESFPSHLQNAQPPMQNFSPPMNAPFPQPQQHFNPPVITPIVQQPTAPVPLVSSDQQANRQAMLEQLRIQEQQQLAKLMAPKPEIVQPKPAFTIPPPVTSPIIEDKNKNHAHGHHDILRQHNEEYRVLQAKKSAVQMANMRYGHYSSHDSIHFNFIVPVLPTLHILNSESSAPTEKNENTVS